MKTGIYRGRRYKIEFQSQPTGTFQSRMRLRDLDSPNSFWVDPKEVTQIKKEKGMSRYPSVGRAIG